MPHNSPDLDTLIIDTVGSIVVVCDREGRIVRFNHAGTRVLGYSPQEALGKKLCEFFALPEHQRRCLERFHQTLTGATIEVNAVWLTRSGERRHIAFVCRGAPGADGKCNYSVGTGIDITERVAAEKALGETERRFRTMFADAAIGIALVDEKGRYVDVNRAFCELTGYSKEELLERDLLSITHPDDRPQNVELLQSVFQGRRQAYVFEKRYIRRTGEIVQVQVSASLAREVAGQPVLIGLFQNISERKKAEEAQAQAYGEMQRFNETLERRVEERTRQLQARTEELARSEQSLNDQTLVLRSILKSMGDGVFVANGAGRVVLMNPAAERMTAPLMPGAETVQERARQPWFFHEDGITPFRPKDLQLYRSVRGASADDEEVLIRRPDKPEIWVSATSRPLLDEKAEIQGAVLVLRDVTERRRDAAAVREANMRLEQANKSLRQSENHYKVLAESHLRLAREVEHRVRNNLAGLLALVSVMRDRSPDLKTFADSIAGRLAAMLHVHQLLANAGWTRVELHELIDGALAILGHLAPYPATTRIEGPAVSIGPTQVLPLTLVLIEWFTNSCKYGAHGSAGGRLEIEWKITGDAQEPRILLTWKECGGMPVASTIKPSLGTQLVEGFVRQELAGRCELRYPAAGADHEIEFAIRDEA
ncbi:MAG TPA: PAS domain S-box protein [Tepidisphaeraceae bacterium]|jgi:PAS domain S-box-containing protein|nr:PAS domain S-box protein [Tepidisphaeraceae bacterium]